MQGGIITYTGNITGNICHFNKKSSNISNERVFIVEYFAT